MINSITLNNFKCYREQSFSLSNLTVFCGNNSVGKSTAIQSLMLALQNNFSEKLDFEGDFIRLGSYSDIYNKDADSDFMSITLDSDEGSVKWESEARLNENSISSDDGSVKSREGLEEKYQNNFTFLCAERWGPRSNYPYSLQRRSEDWLGAHGEYTPQVLSDITLNSRALPKDDCRIHDTASGGSLTENLFSWMAEISPGVFIKANPIAEADVVTNQYQFGEHTYRATNVGFGLSYTLPVVLSLLMAKVGGLVIIENPEAHLHPRGQSYLGRLIALSAQAGVQVMIETHSDHLLNGMRLMARSYPNFDPNIFTLYFISRAKNESVAEKITLDKKGKLSSWPEGFFDQQTIDMFTIMTGNKNLPTMPEKSQNGS